MREWSESKKFWFETFRSIVFAVAVYVAARFFTDDWDRSNAYKAEIDKTKLEIRSKVVDEFAITSYRYTEYMYDVIKPGYEKKEYDEYTGSGYSDYTIARDRLMKYFSSNKSIEKLILDSKKLNDEIHSHVEYLELNKNKFKSKVALKNFTKFLAKGDSLTKWSEQRDNLKRINSDIIDAALVSLQLKD